MPSVDGLSMSSPQSNSEPGKSSAENPTAVNSLSENKLPDSKPIDAVAAADTPTAELGQASQEVSSASRGDPGKMDKGLPDNPADIEARIGTGAASAIPAGEEKPASAVEPNVPPVIRDGDEQPPVTKEAKSEEGLPVQPVVTPGEPIASVSGTPPAEVAPASPEKALNVPEKEEIRRILDNMYTELDKLKQVLESMESGGKSNSFG